MIQTTPCLKVRRCTLVVQTWYRWRLSMTLPSMEQRGRPTMNFQWKNGIWPRALSRTHRTCCHPPMGEIDSSAWPKKGWWAQVPPRIIVIRSFTTLSPFMKKPSSSPATSWNFDVSCYSSSRVSTRTLNPRANPLIGYDHPITIVNDRIRSSHPTASSSPQMPSSPESSCHQHPHRPAMHHIYMALFRADNFTKD